VASTECGIAVFMAFSGAADPVAMRERDRRGSRGSVRRATCGAIGVMRPGPRDYSPFPDKDRLTWRLSVSRGSLPQA
jgi:hypothetical protein